MCAVLDVLHRPLRVQAWFDGGCKESIATAGWYVMASWGNDDYVRPEWRDIATGCAYIGLGTSMIAELCAAEQAILAAFSFVHVGHLRLENHNVVCPAFKSA